MLFAGAGRDWDGASFYSLIGPNGGPLDNPNARLRLRELEAIVADGSIDKVSKKEGLMLRRELEKLERSLGGIKDLQGLPSAIFVIDVGYQKGTVTEAQKLGIPVIGIVDTNHSPLGVDYVIPGNDDSSQAIRLYARGVADAILEGRAQALTELTEQVEAAAA